MKSSELIKLRFDTVELLYTNGNISDTKQLINKAKDIINFISTGDMKKKPVLTGK